VEAAVELLGHIQSGKSREPADWVSTIPPLLFERGSVATCRRRALT
jgi:hypothetical protein